MTNRAPGTRPAAPVHNFQARRTAVPSTESAPSALKLAHATLVGALLREQADPITGCWAHPSEVIDRSEHLQKVLSAVTDYVNVVLADTQDYAGRIEAKHLTGLLRDATSDIVGGVAFAAEEAGGGDERLPNRVPRRLQR
jgi:hypothetical protein